MPVTQTEFPILSHFFSVAKSIAAMQSEADRQQTAQLASADARDTRPQQLPKGVVIGKDGKPCRSCTSVKSWMAMAKGQKAPASQPNTLSTTAQADATLSLPPDCPADVEELGRSSWTLLHTMAATYPERPTPPVQQQAKTFVSLFANLYPCSHCAEDFQGWMQAGNPPKVGSREEFGLWMCNAHNAVNKKLGKELFDCAKWEERWRTGPADGSCG